MRLALRTLAVIIAIAAAVDPAATRRVTRPAAVELTLPPTSHADYPRALDLKQRALEQLRGVVRLEDVDVPVARLAIGQPGEHVDPASPLFAVSLPAATVGVEELNAPERAAAGQQIVVQTRVRGRGIEGQTSSIQLGVDGVTVATGQHRWRGADDVHDAEFVIPALSDGIHRLRVTVVTNDSMVTADDSVAVDSRPRRVLVFEPRPSWPAAFARRSLEEDPSFDLSTLARSAPRVAITSGDRPSSLAASRLDAFDAVLVGGLDAISDAEARVLADFVARRGGSLVLVPDGRVPSGLRQRLGLPPFEEFLLQEPIQFAGGGVTVSASEFLVPALNSPVSTIVGIQRDQVLRPVVFASPLGNGTIVVSGALDAWRYRGNKGEDLGRFTRSLVADAAAAAPPPITISLARSLERPAEPVTVLVTLRETELTRENGRTSIPRIAAASIDEKGHREVVRLWPTSRAGEFVGEVRAAREGRYVLEAAAGGQRAETVLTIAADVTHPRRGEYPLAAVAALTGGAAHESLDGVRESLAALGSSEEVRRWHPMRSAWWIIPFVGLLTAEWILRRRAGLR